MNEKGKNTIVILTIIIATALILITVGIYYIVKLSTEKEVDVEIEVEKESVTSNKVYEEKEFIYDAAFSNKELVLPFLNIKGDGAEKINLELMVKHSKLKEEDTRPGGDPWYSKVEYKHYQNGDIISILLTQRLYGTSVAEPKYTVYNVNAQNGQILTSKDILNLKETTDERLKTLLETEIKKIFEKEEYKENIEKVELDKYEKDTIEKMKSEFEKIQLYLNTDNKITSVVKILIPAQSGENTRINYN